MTSPTRGDQRFGTTLGVLREAVATWPDHPAIEDGDTTLSFRQVHQEV